MEVLWNNLQTERWENFYYKTYSAIMVLVYSKACDKQDKYVDWRDLEMWVRWSIKVIGNGLQVPVCLPL